MKKNYSDFGIEIPSFKTSGNVKVLCPHCHNQRTNKRDKSLSVNLDKGIWHCHYCSWSGTLHVGERTFSTPHKVYRKPTPRTITAFSEKSIEWFKNRGISHSTLKRMRVSEGEEFMPQTGCKMNTIQFNYYLNNELINVKYRTGNKHFKLESGAELIPYNLDSIVGKSDCIITEGEMDCLSFIEVGYSNCISVPNGANNNLSYLDDFIDGWFEDKQTIYIAVDTDAKGLMLRDELTRRFGVERCKIVSYGTNCKDANDHLVKYGKESLRNCIKEAKDIKIEEVYSVTDIEDPLDQLYQQGLPQGVTIGLPNFDKLCSFETKRLAIVTGIPGSGKSEFIDQIVEALNVKHGWKTAFFSPENAPIQLHASKLIEKLTGKSFRPDTLSASEYEEAKQYMNENFFFIYPKEDFSVENILAKARYLIRKRGIKALVIDPYNRLDITQGRNKETDVVRDILRSLISFAQQNDVLIFLMAHPTKMAKNQKSDVIDIPTLYDIAGSAHFFNMADYGIVVHRNRVNETVEVKVSKVRFKHLGSVGTANLKYHMANGRYASFTEGQTTVWDTSNHIHTHFQTNINVPQVMTANNTSPLKDGVLFEVPPVKPLIAQLYD